jgi:Uma2 family endonuclease
MPHVPDMTTREYLQTPETNRHVELVHGIVREPAAPAWGHQTIVLQLGAHLMAHVRRLRLGRVGVAPIDVVLDAEHHLIVQPDLVFVSNERAGQVAARLWGAPDIAVEVLSLGSRSFDRQQKRRWYREYGVREYWLVDPVACAIEVIDLAGAGGTRTYHRGQVLRSTVLSRLRLGIDRVFET